MLRNEFLFPLPFIHSFVNAGLNILYSTQRIKMLGKFTRKVFLKVSDKPCITVLVCALFSSSLID